MNYLSNEWFVIDNSCVFCKLYAGACMIYSNFSSLYIRSEGFMQAATSFISVETMLKKALYFIHVCVILHWTFASLSRLTASNHRLVRFNESNC